MSDASADGSVRNEATGSVGISVQAGAIHGDVHLHPSAPSAIVPRQLPSASRYFVNRAVEQDALTTVLGATATEGTARLATIDGIAGVGKSTLAVHWAQRVRDRFPDGQLYVNLRGFDPVAEPMAATDALGSFLSALDVPSERIPEDLGARSALFRSTIHDRRLLMLLDNARDATQIRPLLPGNHTAVAVVTSRNRFSGLVASEGASRIALAVLTAEEARDLLVDYLGHRVTQEPESVRGLIEHCAGLPLALGIVAARAVAEPDFPLSVLVSELQDERDRLDALDAGGETGIRAVFSWSYRSISPEAARLFRLLGLPTGPDISLRAIADLAGIPTREARRLLNELSHSHLVEQPQPGRYRFHDLLRAYAAECAAQEEAEEDRLAAIRRLLDHYLRTSRGIRNQFMPHIQYFVPPPSSDIPGIAFDDFKTGLDWWDDEKDNFLAGIRQASTLGFLEHTWQLSHSLMPYFHTRSHTEAWTSCHTTALAATRTLGERKGEAYLLHELGVAHHDRAEFEDSVRCREQALAAFEELGNTGGETDALIGLGHSYIDIGRMEAAAGCFDRARTLAAGDGDRYDEGQGYFGIGRVHLMLGEFAAAVPRFEESLACYAEVGEVYGRGFGLNMLADAYQGLGRSDEAIESYRLALAQFRDLGHRLGESIALRGLGTVLLDSDPATAREHLRHALAILDDLAHPDAEALRAKLSILD